jgi:hypothetical protein
VIYIKGLPDFEQTDIEFLRKSEWRLSKPIRSVQPHRST